MKKIEQRADLLTETTRQLLRAWIVEKDRQKTFDIFMDLAPEDRFIVSMGLKDVVSTSSSPDFRQAARDIPAFIKSKL